MVTVQEIRERKAEQLERFRQSIEEFRQADPETAAIVDTALGTAATFAAGAIAGPAIGAAAAGAGRLRGSISTALRKSVRQHAAKGTLTKEAFAKASGQAGVDTSAGAPGITKGVGRFSGVEPGRFGQVPAGLAENAVASAARAKSALAKLGGLGKAGLGLGGAALLISFIFEESSQTFSFAVKSAIDAGDTQLATQIIAAQEDMLNSVPVKLAGLIPGFGSFFEAAKQNVAAAKAQLGAPGKTSGRTPEQSFEAGKQFELGQQSAFNEARPAEIQQDKDAIALKLGFNPGEVRIGGIHEGKFRKALQDSGLRGKFEALELEESKLKGEELHFGELAPEGKFSVGEIKKLREGVAGVPGLQQSNVGPRTSEQIRKGAGLFTPAPAPKKKAAAGGGAAAAGGQTQATAGFSDIRGATGAAPLGPKKRAVK